MTKKPLFALALLLLLATPLRAQFYVAGNEGSGVRWRTIGSENYRFVYPEGCDSLAHAYALEWERVRGAVGFSSGLLPNEAYRRPMPVVLHPFLGYSNGVVAWTPRRMDMYTGPEMYSPDPLPWMSLLALHEGRHVSQMQYVGKGWMRALSFLSGELPAGLSLFFTEPSFMEGDAVAAETALTLSGRGRTADFLEYYRVAADEGQLRSYARWRYGSQKLFTPDYYKLGYLTMAGLRTWGGQPNIVKEHLQQASDWGFDSFDFNRRVRRSTGLSLSGNFDRTLRRCASLWKEDEDARAPFMCSEQLTELEDHFVEYKGLAAADGQLFAIRSGQARHRELVRLDVESHSLKVLSDCAAASRLALCGNLVLWSETLPSLRWEMQSSSALRCYDGRRNRTLVGGSRLFNPCVGADSLIAVCASPYDGSQAVETYKLSGELVERIIAPAGLQPYECCFVGGELFCAALSAEGEGIYRVKGFEPVLEPSPVKINHIFSKEGRIYFVSDRTGVNELYSLNPEDGGVLQLSNLRGGGTDFVFMDGYLYYTVLSTRGRMICRTPEEMLPARCVDFSQRCSYPLADSLSALEQGAWAEAADSVMVTEPKRYSKGLHALKIHSWLPFYIDADDVTSLSLSSVTLPARLGASVMFQNELNTLYGSAGFNFAEGFAGHFTYSGLYPKFEVRFASGLGSISRPYASVKTYVPVNFTSDGWRRAVIPSASVLFSPYGCVMSAAVRAYAIQNIPSSCIYPRWGIGAEAGVRSGAYLYGLLYGYLPGFYETHGFSAQLYYEAVSRSASAAVSYAMPVLPVDWDALSPLVYVKNFELIPFWSFNHSEGLPFLPLNYHTVGASFSAVLGNFWLIPYDIHLGLRYSWRINMENPHGLSLVFSVDI